MKRVFALFLAVLFVAGLSVTALAADDNFIDESVHIAKPDLFEENDNVEFIILDDQDVIDAVNALVEERNEEFIDQESPVYGEVADAFYESNEKRGTDYTRAKVDRAFKTHLVDPEADATLVVVPPANFFGLFKLEDGKWDHVEIDWDEVNGKYTFTPEESGIYAQFVGVTVGEGTGEFHPSATRAIEPVTVDKNYNISFLLIRDADVLNAIQALMRDNGFEAVDSANAAYAAVGQALESAKYDTAKVDRVFKTVMIDPNGDRTKTIIPPEDFLGLFKLDNGKWVKVDTKSDADGNVSFEAEHGAVYAIFVGSTLSPATGESANYVYLFAAVALAGAAVLFFRKSRLTA